MSTLASGAPTGQASAALTVGTRGPILLQDINLIDELAHFTRERIPERVVHAKGAGALGYFEVTHDITKFSCAKVFAKIGQRTVSVLISRLERRLIRTRTFSLADGRAVFDCW